MDKPIQDVFLWQAKTYELVSGDDLQGSENNNGHADSKAEKGNFAQCSVKTNLHYLFRVI